MDFIDIKMQQDKEGFFDIVLDNGGIEIDDTLETSIAATLFTDNYNSSMPLGQRRGGVGVYYGNNAWIRLLHRRSNDDEAVSYINNEYNSALQEDFTSNDVWQMNEVEVDFVFNSLNVKITGKNTSDGSKFDYNYKLSGR